MFVDIIFAYFSASDPDSGVTSYEVAWGTGPNLVDVSDFEEIINNTIWRAKLKDGALEGGKNTTQPFEQQTGLVCYRIGYPPTELLSENPNMSSIIHQKLRFSLIR